MPSIKYYFVALLVTLSLTSYSHEQLNLGEIKKFSQRTIEFCHQKLDEVQALQKGVASVTTCPISSDSAGRRKAYCLIKMRQAFNLRFLALVNLYNTKIGLRTMRDPAELQDKVMAYSSNCSRFADGLIAFAGYTMGQQVTPNQRRVFENFIKTEKI